MDDRALIESMSQRIYSLLEENDLTAELVADLLHFSFCRLLIYLDTEQKELLRALRSSERLSQPQQVSLMGHYRRWIDEYVHQPLIANERYLKKRLKE